MLSRFAWSVAVVAVAGLAAASFALAASPPLKGQRYVGESSQHRKVSARVTSDGKKLQFHLTQIYKCNNGRRKSARSVFLNQAPAIKADGTFSYHKVYDDEKPVKGFDQVHSEEQTVTGSFSDGGKRVDAVVKNVTTGKKGLTCSSTVTFTARARGA
jgi:hypothetical protein